MFRQANEEPSPVFLHQRIYCVRSCTHLYFRNRAITHGIFPTSSRHADDQAVQVKDRVPAAVEDPVDRNRVDGAADHVDGHDHHHPREVAPRLIRQDDHAHRQRRDRQHDARGHKADHKGQVAELNADSLSFFQSPRAELVADHDAGRRCDAVAHAADEVTDDSRDRIGRCRIRPHVADDRRIRGKSHAPAQAAAKERQALPHEVPRQSLSNREELCKLRPHVGLPHGNAYAQAQLDEPGDSRRQGGAARLKARRAD